jgi:PilZ domain
MNQPVCPECSMEYVRRVRRQSIAERLLSVFYIYPFRCQLCGYRFKTLRWGEKYVRFDEDARDYERLERNIPFTLICKGMTITGWVSEISMSGCTLQTLTPIRLGQVTRLQLHVPTLNESIMINAAIVKNTSDNRAGLEFLRLSQRERKRLQSFIRNEINRNDFEMKKRFIVAA